MLVHRSVDPKWLSNSWLVASEPGRDAVVIDAGAPPGPLLDTARKLDLSVKLVVLTHHHGDHVCERAAFAPAPCAMHALDKVHVVDCEREVADGERIEIGGLALTVLHAPGHTRGQVNVRVDVEGQTPRLFTGDTLFRRSVGGTRAPGHGTFAELKHTILDRLLTLPPATIVHAGHGQDTTIGDEAEHNPFVRAWRGRDAALEERCLAFGERATLLTWATDYDGGAKAWVRWTDGSEDTIPGSRVTRT
jgi:hydroxyacylglutathione hydrolase